MLCRKRTWDGSLSAIILDGTSFSYTYDDLRRLETVSNGVFTSRYSYWDDEEAGKASPRLKSIVHEGVNYSGKTVECNYTYTYDVNGNITSAAFGNRKQTYVYDANNQLIRENNDRRQYTQTWEYDEFGNITATRKYAYTTGELGTPTSTVTYGYTDSSWGDLLTQYNGKTIEYDEVGNPVAVKNGDTVVKSYTWEQGRQLKTLTQSNGTWNYSYDISGLRTQRTNDTTTYEYIYAGDKLVRMVKNGEIVDFGYAGNQLATMTYDGVTYYYVLNGQGDVIGLTDNTGKMVIGYVYSAYGIPTPLKADETLTPILKLLNPFMYRGYVYDIETGLYYLQSRYYDPEMGRFINADALVSTGQGVLGNNMFAYCGNNPIKHSDPLGYCPCNTFGRKIEYAYSSLCPNCFAGGASGGAVLLFSLTDFIDKVLDSAVVFSVSYAYRQYTRYIKASFDDMQPSNYPVTHHIIPYGKFSTRSESANNQLGKAQDIMKRAGVDPEKDLVNQMVLSYAYHSFLHTDKYILAVSASIINLGENPSKEQIYAVLNDWRMILAASDPFAFPY